jgi:hypothetical protein
MRYSATLIVTMLHAGMAAAQPSGPGFAIAAPAGDHDEGVEPEQEPPFVPSLERGWRFGGSFQAYSGIVAYRAERTGGHGVLGGAARARYGRAVVGGFYEVSDSLEQGRWTSNGGFGGVHLPFDNWVDVEAVVGAGVRTHAEDDPRYGPNGYSWSTPTLCFRLGVTDRSGESVGAVRLGAELFGSIDLKRSKQAWRYEFASVEGVEPRVVTGETSVGGVSVGLAFTIGIDFAQRRVRPAVRE